MTYTDGASHTESKNTRSMSVCDSYDSEESYLKSNFINWDHTRLSLCTHPNTALVC